MPVSTTTTDNLPTDNNDFAAMNARIAALEAQLQDKTDSEKKLADINDELRKRNAVLRSETGEPDPELKTFLEQDIAEREAALDKAAAEVRRRPHDRNYMLEYSRCKRELKAAREQMAAQFPAPAVIPRALSPQQEQERAQIEAEFQAAKKAWGGKQHDIVGLSRYAKAEKARRQFWNRVGMRMQNP